ncbi:hypothetical protein BDW74DRAFT_177788 [Aspergillus multicolor]|uniref:uncharacterized protein n=1 Tax=Aspergillus multicolor TaxID=41759 RepID=UPI003CCD14E2
MNSKSRPIPPSKILIQAHKLPHPATNNKFKHGASPKRADASTHFDIILAIRHATGDEACREWVVFLTDLHAARADIANSKSRSYITLATPHGYNESQPSPGVHHFTYDLVIEEYIPLGTLPSDRLDLFEGVFISTPPGPKNFFIARWFGILWEDYDLTSELAVEVPTYIADYTEDEFEANNGSFNQWDMMHIWRWGDNDERLPEYQSRSGLPSAMDVEAMLEEQARLPGM